MAYVVSRSECGEVYRLFYDCQVVIERNAVPGGSEGGKERRREGGRESEKERERAHQSLS